MADQIIFNTKKYSRIQRKKLNRGRSKDIGIVERVRVHYAGRKDGINKKAIRDSVGNWTTPYLKQEEARYEEFCSRLWGMNQIECHELFVQAETMLADIRYKRELTKRLNDQKSSLSAELKKQVSFRKKGEEELTDSQITARRQRENVEQTTPLNSRINLLEQTISENFAQLFKILNVLIEYENAFQYICMRQKDHTMQRVYVYWNTLLKYYSEKEPLSASPCIYLKADAERVFCEQHESLIGVYSESQKQYDLWNEEQRKEAKLNESV